MEGSISKSLRTTQAAILRAIFFSRTQRPPVVLLFQGKLLGNYDEVWCNELQLQLSIIKEYDRMTM